MKLSQLSKERIGFSAMGIYMALICVRDWKYMFNPMHVWKPPTLYQYLWGMFATMVVALVGVYLAKKLKTKSGKILCMVIAVYSVIEVITKIVLGKGFEYHVVDLVSTTVSALWFCSYAIICILIKEPILLMNEERTRV